MVKRMARKNEEQKGGRSQGEIGKEKETKEVE